MFLCLLLALLFLLVATVTIHGNPVYLQLIAFKDIQMVGSCRIQKSAKRSLKEDMPKVLITKES
ncbi:hypothetical protein EB619_21060 [Escherichia coli]|nr:hypothetical protein [Escherichia coli]